MKMEGTSKIPKNEYMGQLDELVKVANSLGEVKCMGRLEARKEGFTVDIKCKGDNEVWDEEIFLDESSGDIEPVDTRGGSIYYSYWDKKDRHHEYGFFVKDNPQTFYSLIGAGKSNKSFYEMIRPFLEGNPEFREEMIKMANQHRQPNHQLTPDNLEEEVWPLDFVELFYKWIKNEPTGFEGGKEPQLAEYCSMKPK